MAVQNPKISVIVPIYNSEKYLNKCIDSVLNQTFTDFELLLIDDGSTDRSGEICDKYEEEDCRIKVFHKKNGGVASARQLGVDNMAGEYSIQFDSDDWVEPDMLERMYSKALAERSDIVVCDIKLDRSFGRSLIIKQGPIPSDNVGAIKDIVLNHMGSLCNKLMKSTCYTTPNKISFEPEMNIYEDLIMNCKILSSTRRVSYLPLALYHYVSYNNSYSLSKSNYQYPSRVRLTEILDTLLNRIEFSDCREFLEMQEANCALVSGALSKYCFLSKYKHILNYEQLVIRGVRMPYLKMALRGKYHTARLKILIRRELSMIFNKYISKLYIIYKHTK